MAKTDILVVALATGLGAASGILYCVGKRAGSTEAYGEAAKNIIETASEVKIETKK